MSKKTKIIIGIAVGCVCAFGLCVISTLALVIGGIFMMNAVAPGEGDHSGGAVVRGEKFVGTAFSYGGDIIVEVCVDGDDILSVEVISHNDSIIGEGAFEYLIPIVVERDTWRGIDGYTGATISSYAFLEAVEDALEYSGYFD